MDCPHCGATLTESTKFCTACGLPLSSGMESSGSDGTQIKEAGQPYEANRAGIDQNRDVSGPLRFIKASIHAGMDSVRIIFKNPKKLIPMLILSGFWLILSILPALGINPGVVRFLSFLTFAQGGMYGGILGAAGGIIGKAIFAYFVTALLFPLFSGKKPFKDMGRGFKSLVSGFVIKNANEAGQLIVGIGLALIVFNFLTGNASLVNSMAGVFMMLLAIRSLWSRAGFFWGLLLSVANKLAKGRVPMQETVSRLLSGYVAGSAAGIALSALWFPYLPYALGALLLLAGLVLGICAKAGKEAAVV